MRAHHRGGIILMVPSLGDEWRQSIVHPIPYAIDPPFTALADLMRRADEEHDLRAWQEELEDLVDHVAGLTAVDGATILTDRCEVLGFGAKITRRKGSPLIEECGVTEPIEGGEAALVIRRCSADAPSRSRPVRVRPAQRRGAGRVAGWSVYRVHLVAMRGTRACAPGGDVCFKAIVRLKPDTTYCNRLVRSVRLQPDPWHAE
jgi:hypothetical protein